MGRFEGKTVLVTGGGTGIGHAIAVAFAREGARVAVAGRRGGPLAETAREMGPGAVAVSADLARPGEPARLARAVRDELGRLDVLVNNAAVFPRKRLEELTDEDLGLVFGANVVGLLALTREALPLLRASRGTVVNVSSTASRVAKPGLSAYSASKAAVEQVTRALAAELGPDGIRVNCIAPGMTDTDMIEPLRRSPEVYDAMVSSTPLGRIGRAEDVARAVLFVASDDASWITGQVLQSSGGFQL